MSNQDLDDGEVEVVYKMTHANVVAGLIEPGLELPLRPLGRKGGSAAHRPLIFAGLPATPLPPFITDNDT